MRLTTAAICTARHPAVWKRASGMVIQNSGNADYIKLKIYRSISLFGCIGNVIEKVASELL